MACGIFSTVIDGLILSVCITVANPSLTVHANETLIPTQKGLLRESRFSACLSPPSRPRHPLLVFLQNTSSAPPVKGIYTYAALTGEKFLVSGAAGRLFYSRADMSGFNST